MHSSHPHLTNQKAFYVEISRAREDAFLITDDRQTLGKTLSEETGVRIAALEAAPEEKSFDQPFSEPSKDIGPEMDK